MPNIEIDHQEKVRKEKEVPLSTLQPNQYFRFPSTSFEELTGENGDALLFVVIGKDTKDKEKSKEEFVHVFTSDHKLERRLNGDRLVIRHHVRLLVSPAETVEE